MKKIISTVLAFTLLFGMVLTLVSCGKTLSGTYSAEILGYSKELVFSGNKVTIKTGVGDFAKEAKASYKIEENAEKEGEYTITFTYEEGETKDTVFNGTLFFEESSKGDDQYITIGIYSLTKK